MKESVESAFDDSTTMDRREKEESQVTPPSVSFHGWKTGSKGRRRARGKLKLQSCAIEYVHNERKRSLGGAWFLPMIAFIKVLHLCAINLSHCCVGTFTMNGFLFSTTRYEGRMSIMPQKPTCCTYVGLLPALQTFQKVM